MRAASYRPGLPRLTDPYADAAQLAGLAASELCLLASVETECAVCRQPAKLGAPLTACAGAAAGAAAAAAFGAAAGHGGPPEAVEWSRATEQPEATEPLSAMESPEATEPLVAWAL